MNRALTEVVMSVLGFARPSDPPPGLIGRAGLRDWDLTLTWLDRSGLSLYFRDKLHRVGLQEAVPPAVSRGLEARYTRNLARTNVLLREWRNLQGLFNSSGAPSVVLKGIAKIPDYSPDPALRVQFDHDWLINRSSLDRVTELLRSAGYQRKNKPEVDRAVYVKNAPRFGDAWNPSDSYDARLPRPVEIHLDLWDSHNEKILIALPGDLISRRVSRMWRENQFYSLSDEDALIFEAIHTFRHIIHNWCRLSLLFELAHFLDRRSSDRSFWLSFSARIENNLMLRRIAGVVFALAGKVFGVPNRFGSIPFEFFAQTTELRMWVNRYGRNSALRNFSEDKFSLFLIGEFVRERDDWCYLRRRRLFPLQPPHRLAATIKKSGFAGLTEKCRRGMHFVRRVSFHLRGILIYAWEFPQWRFLIRYDTRNRLSPLSLDRSQAGQARIPLPRRAYEPPAD